MNDLQSLRERVEKADASDPIALEILTEDVLRAIDPAIVERCKRHFEGFGGGLYYPKILTSIDAAVALIERKLPGRDYTISVRRVHPYMGEYPFEFTIWGADKYHQTDGASAGVHKYSICLAALAALLSALETHNG